MKLRFVWGRINKEKEALVYRNMTRDRNYFIILQVFHSINVFRGELVELDEFVVQFYSFKPTLRELIKIWRMIN